MPTTTSDLISKQITSLTNSMSSVGGDKPSDFTRYMGGHNRSNQPYINGYHQIIVQPPTKIFGINTSDASTWLSSTCEGFTPHSITTNFVELVGLGQIGSSFPSSRTVNREFTLTFREYRNLPILQIFRMWHSLFDTHIGISTLKASDFIPSNYKGCIMVGILKPTAVDGKITVDDIEEVYRYEGVFPSVCPDDTITTIDQATQDSVQASITFKFDGAPLDKAYPNLVENFVTTLGTRSYANTYNNIGVGIS